MACRSLRMRVRMALAFMACVSAGIVLTGILAGCSIGTEGHDDKTADAEAVESSDADTAGAVDAQMDEGRSVLDSTEVSRASIVDGSGVGGTASASSELLEFARVVGQQLGVPIEEGVDFSMGPLILDKEVAEVPLRAVMFYQDNIICAGGDFSTDGTPYRDITPYDESIVEMAKGVR